MHGTVDWFQLDGCLTFCTSLNINSLPPSLVEIDTLPQDFDDPDSINVARCCFEFYFRTIDADVELIAWVPLIYTCFVSSSHV